MRKITTHRNRSSGFTLIELALAALVISMGVLVIFGLSRHGNRSARMAEGEIRATMFADNVFSGLASINNNINRHSVSNEFEIFWDTFSSGNTNLPIAALPMWFSPEENPNPGIICNGLTNTIHYFATAYDPQITTNILEYSFRYHVKISMQNQSDSTSWPNAAQVQLDVMPGSSGREEQYTFVTLFADSGGLP